MRPINLYRALAERGWTVLDVKTHPRAYVDAEGNRYGTLEKDGVRVALSLNRCLAVDRGVVMVYQSDQELPEAILQALIVDPESRRAGKASTALREIAEAADTCLTTVYLEPVPILDRPMSPPDLVRMYQNSGFLESDPEARVMLRRPETNQHYLQHNEHH